MSVRQMDEATQRETRPIVDAVGTAPPASSLARRVAATDEAMADTVLSLGSAAFERSLLQLGRRVSGADLCSAFVVKASDRIEYLLSEGGNSLPNSITSEVSKDYARGYWRRDLWMREVLEAPPLHMAMCRTRCGTITDPSYREFHLRHGVVDRLSIYGLNGDQGIVLSLYRVAASGLFDLNAMNAVAAMGDTLIALVAKHRRLMDITASLGERFPGLTARLTSERGLSEREAEVCSRILHGDSEKDIARALTIELTTVVTYRRRAYKKLGVSDRRSLRRVHGLL